MTRSVMIEILCRQHNRTGRQANWAKRVPTLSTVLPYTGRLFLSGCDKAEILPNILEAQVRQQHDLPAACVIAQQYSSATFALLHFHTRNKKN
jgi:hypothetical protein